MSPEKHAEYAANRARAKVLVNRADALATKFETGAGTPAELAEAKSINDELREMQRFETPAIIPGDNGGNDGYTDSDVRATSAPLETRTWQELTQRAGVPYESAGQTWRDSSEFLASLCSGRWDPRLTKRDGNSTTVEADGGFAVPSFMLSSIFDASLSAEIIRPRARIFAMQGQTLSIPAWNDVDHSTNTHGGFTAEWVEEGAAFTVQTPALRKTLFQAKKLGLLSRVTNELASDSPSFTAGLLTAMQQATAFNLDSAFMSGDGASAPEGILNAPCLVTVAKESGQAAATILTENIVKMWARLLPGSARSAAWIVNPETLPELHTLTLAVGTGGTVSGLLRDDGRGGMTMMGRPVLVSEHAQALGTAGDIMLADLSYYGIGLRAAATIDVSQAPYFTSDELGVRLKIRIDGKALLASAITPAKGAATLSPFVVLATRA
jgi:HK97 family phage major capsid protein